MLKSIDQKSGLFKTISFFTILFLIILFSSNEAFAKNCGEVKGKVIDKSTQKPLVGATVLIEHTTTGAITNVNGEYHILKVPEGEAHIVASMVGYRMEHKIANVQCEKVTEINFNLHETILEMGAIVVTGTSTPHIYEDMPVRTEVIPRLLIEQKQAVNLADALSCHTGVRVENNCSNCNFTQVRILGLDGKYSQILIDNDPVVSSLAGVYGLEQIPEEMVDQIEIVKGGGSSLYGGGAVAGVINLITRRPSMNKVRIKYLGSFMDTKSDNHVGAMAEIISKDGISGAYIFGSVRHRNPYDRNDDGYSELGILQNESVGFNWYLKPIEDGEFSTHFHHIHEKRRGGNKFDLPPHEAEIAEALESWRWGGTVKWTHRLTGRFDYKLFYSFAMQDRKSYYGGLSGYTERDSLEALKFYGNTSNPLHVGGMQANYIFDGQIFTGGFNYNIDKLEDKTAANPIYYIDETYTNFGFFLQDILHFFDKKQLEFVIGARIDKHSELDNIIFSPRFNAKFRFAEGFTMRAAFTTGFKPPQTYDEDLHLCGLEGDQRITRNADDLKEERSNSFSIGIDYQGNGSLPFIFAFTGFHTTLQDAFSEEFVNKTGDIELWQRVNHGSAKLSGIEVDLGIRPISLIEIRGGFTYKKSEYDEENEDFHTKNFLRTPDFYGNLKFSLNITDEFNLFAVGIYTGKADIPHEIALEGQEDPDLVLKESDSFLQIDMGISYKTYLLSDSRLKFSLGVKNLTDTYQKDLDEGPDRDPAYVYGPILPRTIYFGIETSF